MNELELSNKVKKLEENVQLLQACIRDIANLVTNFGKTNPEFCNALQSKLKKIK